MYLISIYFDEQTDHKIRSYMKQIAKHTNNNAMLEGNVPPHITIGAFQIASEDKAKQIFNNIVKEVCAGEIQWVSVGIFLPQVIYLSSVLNEYLHQLSAIVSKEALAEGASLNPYYRPFSWIPHTTLGKTLNREQMKIAFEVMQNQFGPFSGSVRKIGLAKTNPYTDLQVFEIEETA